MQLPRCTFFAPLVIFALTVLGCFVYGPSETSARVIYSTEYVSEQVDNAFILDLEDDVAGDIVLQFGNALGQTIRYNTASSWFEISGDLNIQGNQLLDFRVDNQATDPEPCTTFIAGRSYFNTTDGSLRYCDGNSWVSVATGSSGGPLGELHGVQARRSTDFSILSNNTWTTIDLPLTDLENTPSVLEHSSADTVTIKESGLYQVFYRVNHNVGSNTHVLDSRILLNGSTEVAGSLVTTSNYQNEYTPNSAYVIRNFSANDTVQLQVRRSTTNQVIGETVLSLVKLEGPQGPAGPQGPPGSPGVSGANTIVQLRDSAGGVNMNSGTATAIPWNTQELLDSGFAHNTSTNNTRLTFTNTGRYRVNYAITGQNSNNGDKSVFCRARLNGSTELPSSASYLIVRQNGYRYTFAANFFVNITTANTYLEVICNRYAGNTSAVNTVANASWVHAERY